MTKAFHAAVLAAILTAGGRNEAQQVRESSLRILAFLTGRWTSTTEGETQEEDWSPTIGDSVVGSFRIVRNGNPVFYEFWAVEVDDGRPVMKLKHFGRNLAGWEEKDASTRMPLVSGSADDVIFAEADGSVSLHYHRSGDTLTCTVHHVRDGKGSDEVFTMSRAGLQER